MCGMDIWNSQRMYGHVWYGYFWFTTYEWDVHLWYLPVVAGLMQGFPFLLSLSYEFLDPELKYFLDWKHERKFVAILVVSAISEQLHLLIFMKRGLCRNGHFSTNNRNNQKNFNNMQSNINMVTCSKCVMGLNFLDHFFQAFWKFSFQPFSFTENWRDLQKTLRAIPFSRKVEGSIVFEWAFDTAEIVISSFHFNQGSH